MPLTPGLQLPFGVQPVNPVAVDSWSGPYTGAVDTLQDAIDAANSSIPVAVRFKSMEVRLIVDGKSRKFWYRDGISDTDLVEFVGGNGGYDGTDTYFYVSGSTDGTDKSVFGGDVVVSGSLFDPTGLKYVKSEENLVQGAVLFGSSTGTVAQNADKIFWDNLQERLGIGTSQPDNTLTVSGSSRTIGELSVTGSVVVTGSAIPGDNVTYDLGTLDKRWKTIFAESGSFTGPVTIEGDLTVLGTQTVISSTIVDIGDNIIVLNSVSSPQRFGGVYVADQDANQTGSLIWDSLNDRWLAGVKDNEQPLISGSGQDNRIVRWIGTNGVSSGIIYDDGSNVGIGTVSGADKLTIFGDVSVTGSFIPGEDGLYDIGTTEKKWNQVYASTGSFGDIYADGNLSVSGSSYLTGSLIALSDAFISGNTSVSGSLNVSGSTYITGSLEVLSDLSLSGNLYVTGTLYGSETLKIGDNVFPDVHLTYDIGSPTSAWKRVYSQEFSGSLTRLTNGDPYIRAGSNIEISTGSNGSITIGTINNGTITSVSAGTGLIGGGSSGTATLAINPNIVARVDGTTFTGAIKFNAGLSGSLTKLSDGITDYIQAGSNIEITTGSNGAITISSTASGGGGAGSGGTIGPAEDGSYEDGLFTDFTSDTPIGTPIDRFNEVLLALAPPPAPRIRNVNSSNIDGISAYLSFGSSNNLIGTSTPYTPVGTTAGFSDTDVNQLYSPTTSPATPASSGNNLRKGIYAKNAIIRGILNDNVTSYVHNTGVTNYGSKTFGNGDTGTLRLEVNGTPVYSVNLGLPGIGAGVPGSGTGSHLNGNNSGFIDLSEPGSGKLSTGIDFPAFKHRTGRYQIGVADQRDGWNYARVIHIIGSNQYVTNYVEWVNDGDNLQIGTPSTTMSFEGSGSLKLSGVEYFRSGSVRYNAVVTNAYRFVYDLNPITFTTSDTATSGKSGVSFGFSSQAKPPINLGAGEDHDKALNISAYSELRANYFLNGTVTAGVNVSHPLKASLVNGAVRSESQILLYDLTNTSTDLVETFRAENYRLLSGSYDVQSDVTNPSNSWDSAVHMLSTDGYSDGLQFYNQQLLSPKNTLNNGNFSSLTNGPSGNPNYSTVSGKRTFYRWFKNTSGAAQYDLSLTMNGSSTIVSSDTSLSSGNLRVYVKIPGSTGWMEVAKPYVFGPPPYADGSGLHTSNSIISFDNTLNAINYLNLGNLAIGSNDYIVVKIEADTSWTGNVSLMTVTFGAGLGSLTPVPDLSNIDSDNTGISARLSFGSSKPITSYANSSNEAGFTPADLNEVYGVGTSGNNLRRGIFSTITNIEGDLNESVTADRNCYVNNAFSDADTGVLRLEVNGTTIHTVDLSTFTGAGAPGAGTGTSLNDNLSGFISFSTWSPGLFDNGVPRYSERQRTARYRVTPLDQRNGWNYLRVVHTVNNVDRQTNYVEWINAPDSNALSSNGNDISIFGDDTFSYVSGVKYFNSPSGSILTRISNIYRNVYTDSASAISFSSLSNASANRIIQSGNGITSTKSTTGANASLQALNTVIDSQNEVLHVTGTINFTLAKSLPGTWTTHHGCGGQMVFQHPYKTSLTTPLQTTSKLLVWTPSDTSNASSEEQFTGETYRIVDATYDSSTSQSVLTNGTRTWNSQVSMNDQTNYPEHATGLLVYDTYLMAPKNGGENGDFRNYKENGSIESPAGNVNYSTLVNPTRTYYRTFLNNNVADAQRVIIYLYGDAVWKAKNGPNADTLGANKNIWVHVGIPGKCGLLDTARPTLGSGNFSEDSGALVGTFNSIVTSSGVNNLCTFNGVSPRGTSSPFGPAERIVIRITASKDWTGYLDRIAIAWVG